MYIVFIARLKIILYLGLCLLIVVACNSLSGAPTPTTKPSGTPPIPEKTKTPFPTNTHLPATATFLPATPTFEQPTLKSVLTPTASPSPTTLNTSIPSASVQPTSLADRFTFTQKCVENPSEMSSTSLRSGKIIFYYDNQYKDLWSTHTVISDALKIQTDDPFWFRFSPNGSRKLVIQKDPDGNPLSYVISSADGSNHQEFKWRPDWPENTFISWVNDNLLGVVQKDDILLLSPDTGEDEGYYHFPDPSKVLESNDQPNWRFNQYLTKMAYRRLSDASLIIYDLQHGKEIADLGQPTLHFLGSMYLWSPDGTLIFYVGDSPGKPPDTVQELFVYDENGAGGQVTNFASLFYEFRITYSAWSPDGKYLAIWAKSLTKKTDQVWQTRLYVLDLASQSLVDYCIDYHYEEPPGGIGNIYSFGITWSPDSTQLITQPGNLNDTPYFLLDIEQDKLTRFPPNVFPFFWEP